MHGKPFETLRKHARGKPVVRVGLSMEEKALLKFLRETIADRRRQPRAAWWGGAANWMSASSANAYGHRNSERRMQMQNEESSACFSLLHSHSAFRVSVA